MIKHLRKRGQLWLIILFIVIGFASSTYLVSTGIEHQLFDTHQDRGLSGPTEGSGGGG
ncbi:hypothetical protein KFU94_03915 [Chloroflexi bacterium TSY]|nr:hypothetical protein [Chloroflexi bacterium TSY]